MGTGQNKTNEGIEAHIVQADVLAVGRNAKAVKNELHNAEFNKDFAIAVKGFTEAVNNLNLDKKARQVLQEDIDSLELSMKENKNTQSAQGALTNIVGKLRMVGIAVKETEKIIEPLKKITKLLKIPLSFIGIG